MKKERQKNKRKKMHNNIEKKMHNIKKKKRRRWRKKDEEGGIRITEKIKDYIDDEDEKKFLIFSDNVIDLYALCSTLDLQPKKILKPFFSQWQKTNY